MFDIGFAELIIIAVVSLLVIGPERLPGTIRMVSLWLGRLRRGFNEIKQEVQQELHNDAVMQELRKAGEEIKQETDGLNREIRGIGDAFTPPPAQSAPADQPEAGQDAGSTPDGKTGSEADPEAVPEAEAPRNNPQ